MATDYEALAREFGGVIETDPAGGMTLDEQGRPVLRANVGVLKPAPLAEATTAPQGSAGAPPVPVRAAEIPPSDYAALAQEMGGTVVFERPAPREADIFELPATIGKGVVKGAASIPDFLAQALGYGAGSIADVLGAPEEVVQGLKNPFTVGGALDVLQPTAPNQEGFERAAEGAAGALSGVGLGSALVKSAAPVVSSIGKTLMEQPALQAISGGTGALSAYLAEKTGYGPVGQTVAGLLGGVAPVAAVPAAKTLAQTIFAPLTPDYPKAGASRLLQQMASNPREAARNLRAATTTLPGVRPTTAELAQDPGLAGLQRALSNTSVDRAAAMGERMQANAAARARAIDEAVGPGDAEALLAAANARQAALLEAAQRAAERVGPLNPADVSGEALRATLAREAAAAKGAARKKYAAVPVDEEFIQIGPFEANDLRAAPPPDMARASFEAEARAATAPGEGLRRAGFEVASTKPEGTLLGWIRKSGGIVRDGPEAEDLAAMGITPKSMPGLFNNNRGSFTKGAARSNLGQKGNRLDNLTTRMIEDGWLPEGSSLDDAVQLIGEDWQAVGRRGVARVGRKSGEDFSGATADADDITAYWESELSARDLNPGTMQPEDWDAFYRDMGGPPLKVDKDDIEFLGAGADKAAGRTEVSPFQASLMTLRRKFFPGTGLPADKNVSYLLRQLETADVLDARQVERIVEDLRSQSGLLRTTDGRSSALAKSAADATEGLLLSQAGPARAEALREARAAWRDYKTRFAENEAGRILATNRYNRETLDTARIPGVAVPGNVTGGTAARRLAEAAGPEAAEQAAREELRRAVELAGPDAGRITALMSANRYGPVLAEYPALAAEIEAVRDAAAFSEAFARSPMGRMREGRLSPSEAVASAILAKDGGRAIRNLYREVRNDPDAQAGLRRAMVDFILPGDLKGSMTAAGEAVGSPLRTMENLNAVLQRAEGTGIFTPRQNEVMGEVLRQLKSLRFASTAAKPTGSDTELNRGLFDDRLARLVVEGVAPGAGRAVRMLDFMVSALGDADAVAVLAREAMLDPQLAASLLERANPSRFAALVKKLGATSRGATIGTAAVVEEPAESEGLAAMPGGEQ